MKTVSKLLFGALMLSLFAAPLPAEAKKSEGAIQGVVNINTATKKELMLLPGIGAKKVEEILAARQTRPFQSPEELVKIKGIGPKKYEKMKEHVVVQGPTTAKQVKVVAQTTSPEKK
ncbi:MAG: helix-hairpin-helix domain-containing protein [Deltaproteobacteria bacterium]|nr:helix-hairpin-helix domain-containing protein [Deltaproteobacteria bacterium]